MENLAQTSAKMAAKVAEATGTLEMETAHPVRVQESTAPPDQAVGRARVHPVAELRFDWTMALLSTYLVGGLTLDKWAHAHHQAEAGNTFFTPWHAGLYSGMAIIGIFLVTSLIRNHTRGHAWRYALPAGYDLSLLGVIIFTVGGLFDFIWHRLYGFEVGVEALLSPAHLFLAVGGNLIITGPLRSLWHKWPRVSVNAPTWSALGPMVISATLFLTALTLFTTYTHPLVDPLAGAETLQQVTGGAFSEVALGAGVSAILFQSALLMGMILLLMRYWTLPFGALTFLITVTSLAVASLHDHYEFVPGAVITGLAADLALQAFKPSAARPLRFHLFAFGLPLVFFGLYFVTVALTQGVAWSVHLAWGAPVVAGVIGLFVSFLMLPPILARTAGFDRATGGSTS
jgi:hypothetical protein